MAAKLEPVTPGQMLREEFLEPLGITTYRLAKDLDVPQDRISAILRGTRAISLEPPCGWAATSERRSTTSGSHGEAECSQNLKRPSVLPLAA